MRDEIPHPELDPASYGFKPEDMDCPIFIDNVLVPRSGVDERHPAIVHGVLQHRFALQYMHISNLQEAAWLRTY
jgi:2-oxoglutarate dehydrogenase E1 component